MHGDLFFLERTFHRAWHENTHSLPPTARIGLFGVGMSSKAQRKNELYDLSSRFHLLIGEFVRKMAVFKLTHALFHVINGISRLFAAFG